MISKDGEDKTANYLLGASKVLARNQKVKYALLKEYSPSCGVHYIHNGKFDNGLVEGQGKTTSLLSKHDIKVFSENEIEELIKEVKHIQQCLVNKDMEGDEWEEKMEIIRKLEDVSSYLKDALGRGIEF